MAFTTRKNILDDLVYRLGMILPANGYQSTIQTVSRQRDTDAEPYSTAELPALNVRDQQAGVTNHLNKSEHLLPVTIEIHTTSRITTAQAEDLLADVARCCSLNRTWSGKAINTTLESHEIDIAQTGDVITAGTVDIQIRYLTPLGEL